MSCDWSEPKGARWEVEAKVKVKVKVKVEVENENENESEMEEICSFASSRTK